CTPGIGATPSTRTGSATRYANSSCHQPNATPGPDRAVPEGTAAPQPGRASAAGWFLGGGAAAGVEDAQHPQRALAGVLQAVRGAGGEVQAAAGGERAIFVAHVEHPLPR